MNKRLWVAVLGLTLVTDAPPIALGYLLFRVWHITILRALPVLIALALIDTYLNHLAKPYVRRWIWQYEARIDLTLRPGAKVPKGSRVQGKDEKDVWETTKDQYADAEGKICLMLNKVRA